jgi:hypothetical protein
MIEAANKHIKYIDAANSSRNIFSNIPAQKTFLLKKIVLRANHFK